MAPNPYLNRTAIKDGRNFIGRHRELNTLYSRIGAGEPQSVSVVGERRIGKSSLLRTLRWKSWEFLEKADEYAFVYVDLQETMYGDVTSFFRALLDRVSEALMDEAIAQLPPTYKSIRTTAAKVTRLRTTLVIMLDEFDAITQNPSFNLDFFSFMRSLPNNYRVSFIVTSTHELQDICHSKEVAGSPFFNIFHKLNLVCLPLQEAHELIAQPSQTAGHSLEPYTAEILQLAGRFPMLLQIACCAYWEFLQDHPGLPPEHEWIRHRFLEEAGDHFAYMWRHLAEREGLVCRKLMNGEVLATSDGVFAQLLARRGYVDIAQNVPRLSSSAFGEYVRMHLERLSPQPENLVGSSVGRFKVRSRLGKGGMGEVFLAEDTKLKRMVALKRLHPDCFADPVARRRLIREAERASQLNDANIAMLYDAIEQDDVIYLVMEYIEGQSLLERMKGSLPVSEVIDIAEQVCRALVSAHAKGIVHCDIKPANILFTQAGLLKVLDFGLAQRVPREGWIQETVTMDLPLGCTVAYASPEILQQQEPDGRSDIFSLGVVLYEAATGRHPFTSSTRLETVREIIHTIPPKPRELNPEIPPAMDGIICKCLAKQPTNRYPTSQALLTDLLGIRSRRHASQG
jgi:tRNA A-37 threonylcarbamoyl transferase component Bud32